MATGTVKFFNGDTGFGFITPAAGDKDVFAQYSKLAGNSHRTLEEGQRVEFDLTPSCKGREAQHVRAL